MKYKLINDTLKTGFNLHCFRSGGGLRVLRLERIVKNTMKIIRNIYFFMLLI